MTLYLCREVFELLWPAQHRRGGACTPRSLTRAISCLNVLIHAMHVGWSQWFGLVGNSVYYDYTISNNGLPETHGNNYTTDYLTDVLNRRACTFLNDTLASTGNNSTAAPFFMWLGTPAAHAPFTPAPQYVNTSAGQNAPRFPNYNQVLSLLFLLCTIMTTYHNY
jgi:hypothetical protein